MARSHRHRRFRLWRFIPLSVVLLFVAANWWTSRASLEFRIALTRMLGYDGCVCADCWPRYGIGGPGPRPFGICGGCRGSAGGPAAGTVVVWLGILISFAPFLPTRPKEKWIDPNRCPTCGYDMVGLPTVRCPECGQVHAQHAPPSTDGSA